MTRTAALMAGRRAAERGMTDTVVIYIPGERTWDAGTSTYVEGPRTETYRGRAKIQFFDNAYEQRAEAGAHLYVIDRSFLHLPWNVTGIGIDQLVEVVASPTQPNLVGGHVWRITNLPIKSQSTSLRLPILEVMG